MRILFPPRPKGKINPLLDLPAFEKTGKYVAQRKYNGTRTLMYFDQNHHIELYDRYGQKNPYQLSPPQEKLFLKSLNLEEGKTYWLDGELLHFKTKLTDPRPECRIKDTIVLYDILWKDKLLFGMNQMVRLELLNNICNQPKKLEEYGRGLEICPNFWLAEVFKDNFVALFQQAVDLGENGWCEGLVLREINSRLDIACSKVNDEVTWQKRCRKPHKNYTH